MRQFRRIVPTSLNVPSLLANNNNPPIITYAQVLHDSFPIKCRQKYCNLLYFPRTIRQKQPPRSDRAIRLPASWESSSWPLLKPVTTSQHSMILRGLRRTLNWCPIMPRDASLSDSGCKISQPRSFPRTPLMQIVTMQSRRFFLAVKEVKDVGKEVKDVDKEV